ncbi:MAG: Maltodextrin-binding protein [Eubacteriales bacterium]|jgi:multiple sugar transport system substrate-binding protein
MKKVISIILSLSILLALMAGCGSSSNTESGGANTSGGSSSGKVTIRFSSWDSAESFEQQQKLVDEFNKTHPNIQVNFEGYGDQYDTKISAAIGAGDAPDVMYMWNYPKYSEALEPLDSYIEKEGDSYKSNFYETLWNYNSMDGKILGLPVGYTSFVLYYNKDLFDKAKVAYPTDDWTWDDLHAAAKKLTDKGAKVYGYEVPTKPDPYDYEMFLWSNGTSYTDGNGNVQGYLNSDKAVQAFTVMQDMLKDGSAISVTSSNYGEAEFKSGKAAMFITGAWSVNTLKDAKVNFGVALLPRYSPDQKSVSAVGASGVAISKTCKNKEAAWEFAKYWTSEELNKARIGYELPVLKSVAEAQNFSNDPIYSKFYTMLEQSSSYSPTLLQYENWSDLSDSLTQAFEQMFNPSTYKNPKDALNEVANNS